MVYSWFRIKGAEHSDYLFVLSLEILFVVYSMLEEVIPGFHLDTHSWRTTINNIGIKYLKNKYIYTVSISSALVRNIRLEIPFKLFLPVMKDVVVYFDHVTSESFCYCIILFPDYLSSYENLTSYLPPQVSCSCLCLPCVNTGFLSFLVQECYSVITPNEWRSSRDFSLSWIWFQWLLVVISLCKCLHPGLSPEVYFGIFCAV